MDGQFTIELKGLHFHAGHGLYAEEQILGNEFEVDLLIDFKAAKENIAINQTPINYVEVYNIVQEAFKQQCDLLETLAVQIANRLKIKFPLIDKIDILIRKLNPPIINFTGSVSVRYIV